MRLVRLLLTLGILALFASSAGTGTDTVQWYSGTIHPHSTFSDGDRTPAMLKNAAAERSLVFMIVNDHNYLILTREKLTGKITDDYGYDKYLRDFSTANSPKVRGTNRNLVCIAGAEVNAGRGHLLILEKLPISLDLHPGQSQEEIISLLTKNDILFGIAHPHNPDYPFDFGGQGADQARGFEIYNDDYAKTFEAYRKSEVPGRFAFTGTDSHTSLDATDLARWAHITQVWVRGELNDESLVAALRNGQTAATNYGAYIKKLSPLPQTPLPQTGVQEVEEVRFDLTLAFGLPILKAKKVRVYRDKELCPESIVSIPVGTKEYRYQWQDTRVSVGVHEYFLVVEDKCLVTSPINLRINRPKPPAPRPKPPVASRPQETISARYYRDSIDEPIKADLRRRYQNRDSSTRLVMPKSDLDRVKNYKCDRRVVQMLVDLSKKHVLGLRIKSGYDTQDLAMTREGNLTPFESAHFDPQAFDIFWVDGIEIAWQVSSDPAKRKKAQEKIRELLREILALGRKNRNQLPTQILVYRQDDLDVLRNDILPLYGRSFERGLNGCFVDLYFWDRIHIGY